MILLSEYSTEANLITRGKLIYSLFGLLVSLLNRNQKNIEHHENKK